MTRQQLTILGCTGSIGVSTLDVVRRHPERYGVFALCAHSQVDKLFAQCLEFSPRFAVVRDARLADQLATRLRQAGLPTEVRHGVESLVAMAAAPEADAVMAAIVGAAGLEPTLAAVRAGKKVLLANKEALVMAGELFMAAVRASGSILLPVDSEHNAIFQSLPANFGRGLAACGVGPGPADTHRPEKGIAPVDATPSITVDLQNVGPTPTGDGSDAILTMLANGYLRPGDEVLYSEHDFILYKIATLANSATPVEIPDPKLRFDVDAALARVTPKTRMVFIANPNNPTGSYISHEEMRRLHAAPLLSPSDSTTIGKYCAVACRYVPHHAG